MGHVDVFVELCPRIGVLKGACVAIDCSNFTADKIKSRLAHLEADVERYIDEMVPADRLEDSEARTNTVNQLARRYGRIRQWIAQLKSMKDP